MAGIFISYSKSNPELALKLSAYLESEGWTICLPVRQGWRLIGSGHPKDGINSINAIVVCGS
jgi:hypothetical protein